MGDTNWENRWLQSLAAVGGGLLTAIIVSGMLPVFGANLQHHDCHVVAGVDRPPITRC